MKKQLKKSKGFSLVELMVAMAITGIILVMVTSVITSSYSSYTRENIKANLQNDAQSIMNSVSDAVMEGKYINKAYATGDTFYIETSKVDGTGLDFEDKVGKNIYYNSRTDTLYVSNRPNGAASSKELKGSIVADNVTEFTMEIDDSCKVYDKDTGTLKGYKNPLKFKVSMKLTERKKSLKYEQTVIVRDKLDKIYLESVEYAVE